jgi:hypothetical protein
MSSEKPKQAARPRLETQIHRRKKAKARSPLLPERAPSAPSNGCRDDGCKAIAFDQDLVASS